jgi:CRISPR-associated protein Csb2
MMFALGIRYLTGYAVATDVSNRQRAEWPPHPARVFMAMAAAHFETGEDPDERAALEWIEQAGEPTVCAGEALPRDVVQYYVPVNDMDVPRNPAKLKSDKVRPAMVIIPQFRTNKQPRTFPCVRVPHDDHGEPAAVYLIWPHATPDQHIRAALERLCGEVIRIGHSSSLVQMWVEDNPPSPTLLPDDLGAERLRIISGGTLKTLVSSYNRDAIDEWAELQEQIANAKGKSKAALKQNLTERFGDREPRSLRPVISRWVGYRRMSEESRAEVARGAFDANLLVLNIEEGPVIGLESTWQLLTAMHKTILKHCDPAPEWLSGHQPDGSPSQEPHLALMPLAFVGRDYADGHVMGLALAFPGNIEPRDRGPALRKLFYDDNGEPKEIILKLGIGRWSLLRETRPTPPVTLQVSTWTEPREIWATVTPIVLDRHPKAERAKDRQQWSLEVAEIITESCERQGLPRPVGIDVDKTSWFRGAPRAVAGKGSEFPLMPVKPGQPARQQVHAWMQFDQKVQGPLLLGAGRYRGYGVCRPLKKEQRS